MEEGSAEKGHVTVVYPAYPNGAQERELLRTLDVVRGLYNHFLAECMFPTPMEMNKGITVMRGQDAGLRSVAVFTLRDAPLRVHAAMTRFAKLSAMSGELRLPRFKSESRYRSLAFDPKSVRFDGRRSTGATGSTGLRAGGSSRPGSSAKGAAGGTSTSPSRSTKDTAARSTCQIPHSPRPTTSGYATS